jgi:hypothetical protein
MKKELTLGFALIAVIAMLFVGIVAADVTKSTTSAGSANTAGGTTIAGSTTSAGSANTAGSTTIAGSTTSAGSANTAGSTTIAGSTTSAGSANTAGSTTLTGTATAAITGVKPNGNENVQLSNLGDTSISLSGFSLTVQDGTTFTLPATTLLPGDDAIIFFQSGTNSDKGTYLNSQNENVLNDIAGSVSLSNVDGSRISSLSYDNSIYAAPSSSPGTVSASSTTSTKI